MQIHRNTIWKGLAVSFVCFLGLSVLANAIPKEEEPLEPPWLFSVHIIAPTSSPVRMQHVQLLESEHEGGAAEKSELFNINGCCWELALVRSSPCLSLR